MEELTFKSAQNKTDDLIKTLGGYWPPLGMLAAATEEIGELAREINALEHIKKKKPSESQKAIGEELADTFYTLICIANHYNVDLGQEYEKILVKYASRDKDRFK